MTVAIKRNGRYYAGFSVVNGVASIGAELTDIRPSGLDAMDCKYCYESAVPVESHEYILGHSMQLLCSLCGAGLTATEPV